MKYIPIYLVLGLLINSCSDANKKIEGYYIEGKAEGVYNGIRAYLKTVSNNRKNSPALDTAMVINEKFIFKGKDIEPGIYTITVDNVKGKLQLVLDNEAVYINIKKDDIVNSEITGSSASELYQNYLNNMQDKFNVMRALAKERHAATIKGNPKKIDSLNALIETKRLLVEDYTYNFIKSHSDNFVALLLLDQKSKSININFEKFSSAYENIDQRLKNSNLGKMLQKTVDRLKIEYEKKTALEVGNKAPEFSATDANGNRLALKDILGKVTLIDFWASWCGPCRRENPSLVKLYEKYHDKGLEILGVSLDRKNQKDNWLKAIKDDKLTWPQVSNLDYFNDPVARQYNITAIPATYLLDSNGIIIAKNLRGNVLENKIKALLLKPNAIIK